MRFTTQGGCDASTGLDCCTVDRCVCIQIGRDESEGLGIELEDDQDSRIGDIYESMA